MTKKTGFGLLILLEIICIFCVYIIRGKIGAIVWSACIFIFAPLASITFIVLLVSIVIRIFKKKNLTWNLLYSAIMIVIAYPITVIFGVSSLIYPTDQSMQGSVEMINPVKNSILFGGPDFKPHAIWPSECYAYDIVKEPYNNGSDKPEDYGVYLADIYSPVSGTVIDLYESEEDIQPNTEEYKSSLGNYIFIKIEDTGTYLILAHLEKDSITVNIGDYVSQGTLIGKVGNSGTTSEPHLHMQHQKDNPMEIKIPILAVGLPIQIDENE